MRSSRWPHYALILAGYALGAVALRAGLPEGIPPSLTFRDGSIVWLGGPMIAFLLPTAVAVTEVLVHRLSGARAVDEPGSVSAAEVNDAIMLRVTVFVLGVHAMVLVAVQGVLHGRAWAAQIVPVMLGCTLISVGNLLPRTRPNLAIGVRTRRTLADRAVWATAHRLVGYIAVACGVVTVVAALAVPRPVGPLMIFLLSPVALVVTWFVVRASSKHGDA